MSKGHVPWERGYQMPDVSGMKRARRSRHLRKLVFQAVIAAVVLLIFVVALVLILR